METANASSTPRLGIYAGLLWLLLGMILGLLKLLYSFLPLFNILDVVVFGLVGGLVARRYGSPAYLPLLAAILPAMMVTSWALFNLSWSELLDGIGTGWLLSALLIPSSAIIGGRVAGRKRPLERQA